MKRWYAGFPRLWKTPTHLNNCKYIYTCMLLFFRKECSSDPFILPAPQSSNSEHYQNTSLLFFAQTPNPTPTLKNSSPGTRPSSPPSSTDPYTPQRHCHRTRRIHHPIPNLLPSPSQPYTLQQPHSASFPNLTGLSKHTDSTSHPTTAPPSSSILPTQTIRNNHQHQDKWNWKRKSPESQQIRPSKRSSTITFAGPCLLAPRAPEYQKRWRYWAGLKPCGGFRRRGS